MIDFAQPGYLALAVLVVVMALTFVWLARWRKAARRDFAGPQAARWQPAPYLLSVLLLIGGAALIVVAAARPQWGERDRLREREGVDLVLVLDISQSMQAEDVQPNRLQVAQDELVRLVEAQRGSRVGLVLFAGTAITRSPLTTDTGAMEELIRRANQETGLTRTGSDMGAALDQASNILAVSESPGKAVVVVSDGEDHVGSYRQKASDLQAKGITVMTAGVGTPEGAQLFDVNARTGQRSPKRDSSGQPVVSKLNESSLRALADAGGGQYERITGDRGALGGLQIDLSSLDPASVGSEESRLPVERYQLFTAAAIIVLLLSWFMPARVSLPRLGRLLSRRPQPGLTLLVIALLAAACGGGDSLSERNAKANKMFAEGDYEGALQAYQELVAERPDVFELSVNAGNALHRLQSYDRAVAETQRALPPKQAGLGAVTYYSLGNHLMALGRLEEAYVAYRNALLLAPGDDDAKHNLELTLLLLGQTQQPGTQPGESGEQPPGEQQTQPGEGQPAQPGNVTPGAPQPASPPGQPAPGQPGQDPDRALAEALAGLDQDLTFEEAVKILDLLRQQGQQRMPAGQQGGSSGPDY